MKETVEIPALTPYAWIVAIAEILRLTSDCDYIGVVQVYFLQ